MIMDTAQVALMDGSTKAAVDLYPEAELLSFKEKKPRPVHLVQKKIQTKTDVICLVLANGKKLLGSRDQRVCVRKNRRSWYTQFQDVEIGTDLVGEAAGMITTVRVIGMLYFAQHQTRLVEFELDHNCCFVAEGVLCR